jgi:ElaA protein
VGGIVEALTAPLVVRAAAFADLAPATLYGILRLRSDVFVVEQDCVFLDADGRDSEPGAVHLWIEEDGEVVGCARVLDEADGSSIGRVVTARSHRRRGVGAALVRAGIEHAARPAAINAQSQLVDWYAGFGFEVAGAEFVEDGIPHTPMVLR